MKRANLVCRSREEHKLRLFENRVLRKIFGAKRDEVTGAWRRLHSEEFRDLYSPLPGVDSVGLSSKNISWKLIGFQKFINGTRRYASTHTRRYVSTRTRRPMISKTYTTSF